MALNMQGDIIQDRRDGWFYRDNGDGTLDSLSGEGDSSGATAKKVARAAIRLPVVLFSGGEATQLGDPLATRVAVVLARRTLRT
jgi:hypothetical protein